MNDDFYLSIKNPRRRIRDVRDLFNDLTEEQWRILDKERRRAESVHLNSKQRPDRMIVHVIKPPASKSSVKSDTRSSDTGRVYYYYYPSLENSKSSHHLVSGGVSDEPIRPSASDSNLAGGTHRLSARQRHRMSQPAKDSDDPGEQYKNSDDKLPKSTTHLFIRHRIRNFFFSSNSNETIDPNTPTQEKMRSSGENTSSQASTRPNSAKSNNPTRPKRPKETHRPTTTHHNHNHHSRHRHSSKRRRNMSIKNNKKSTEINYQLPVNKFMRFFITSNVEDDPSNSKSRSPYKL